MFLTFSLLDENEEWRLVPPLVCSVRGRGLSVSSIAGSDAADIRTIDRWSITACRCAESKQFYYLWVFILRFEWIETQSTTETRQTFNFKLWKSLTFRSIIVSFLEFVVCPTHSNSTERFHTCPHVRKQSWDTNRKRVDVLHREDEEGQIDDVTSGKQREKKWRRPKERSHHGQKERTSCCAEGETEHPGGPRTPAPFSKALKQNLTLHHRPLLPGRRRTGQKTFPLWSLCWCWAHEGRQQDPFLSNIGAWPVWLTGGGDTGECSKFFGVTLLHALFLYSSVQDGVTQNPNFSRWRHRGFGFWFVPIRCSFTNSGRPDTARLKTATWVWVPPSSVSSSLHRQRWNPPKWAWCFHSDIEDRSSTFVSTENNDLTTGIKQRPLSHTQGFVFKLTIRAVQFLLNTEAVLVFSVFLRLNESHIHLVPVKENKTQEQKK